jgi:membrane fusion protein (multidrug efflux system)
MNSRARIISGGAFAASVFMSMTLSGCGADESPQGMPPAQVSAVTIVPQRLNVEYEYTGQTAGSREVEVRGRVTGILLKRNYREGSTVAEGQSLFTIDPAPFEAALSRAEADVAAADARLNQAKRNAARMKPLFEAKAVSQKDYDDAVSGEAIAEADVKSAQARLTEAKLNLGYTRVESPIAGVAGRAQRSEGNYVSGPEVLLSTVTQTNPIHVLFGISDEEQSKLRREVKAGRLVLPKNNAFKVAVKTENGMHPHSGKLDFSDVNVSESTSTSEARAELPNPGALLRPGQFVRVILNGAVRPAAILVPHRAVLEGPAGKFVYVVNAESKAEARPVELGDWYQDNWIVVSGLATGERVIVDGVMKIGPGAPVQIADPNTPAANNAPADGAPKNDKPAADASVKQ